MHPERRYQVAEAIARALRPWDEGEPHESDFAAADAAIAVMQAFEQPPMLRVDLGECGLSPEVQAEADEALAALTAQYLSDGAQARVEALVLTRRSPAERRRYLTEHREQALAKGIPGELIDLLISEAE